MQRLRLLFWLFAAPFALFAQEEQFRTWSLQEGLPQSQVWNGIEDARGYLWFGTQGGGVCRFDGKKFTTFTAKEGLPSNYIHDVFQEKNYAIWVGTNHGLARYNGKKWEALSRKDMQVNVLASLEANQMLAGTQKGVHKVWSDSLRTEKLGLHSELDRSEVYSLFQQKKTWWLGTSSGLWKLTTTKDTRLKAEKIGNFGAVYFVQEDVKTGWLKLGVWGKGLVTFDAEQGKVRHENTHEALTRPLCRWQEASGVSWVGTPNRGLVHLDAQDSVVAVLSEKDGLPHDHVRGVWQAHTGNLWVLTSGGGVARRSHAPFKHLTERDGLRGARIYALAQDAAGRIWTSASFNGVQVIDSMRVVPSFADTLLSSVKVKTLCSDAYARTWVGTEGKGVWVIDSSGAIQLTAKDGLPSDWIQKIAIDTRGQVWVASFADGIAKVRRSKADDKWEIEKFAPSSEVIGWKVTTMIPDKKGRMWLATQGGQVVCFDQERVVQVFDVKSQLPVGAPIRTMTFDGNDNLYAGTKGGGVWSANVQENRVQFRKIEGVLAENIYSLVTDLSGNIWAGSETGVTRIALSDDGTPSHIQFYGRNEGFAGIETCHDAALCAQDGSLWFGTMNGLMQYRPGGASQKAANEVQPFFTGIHLNYQPLERSTYASFAGGDGGLKEGLVLPYHENQLSFSFDAVDIDQPDGVQYAWRLLGADKQWSPASQSSSVNYANLQAGSYTFQVRASAAYGAWSAPIEAKFTISQPFWKNIWFQLGVLASFLGLVLLWVRMFQRKERRRREALEVKHHILQLEQKALQLQMNPHFIFNALNSIQSLIATKDYTVARQEINHFAKLMRSTLNNSRKPSISLEEECETLRQYLGMEQFSQKNPFTFTLEVDEDLDESTTQIPPMLLQPFVENAVIHGVSPLSYPGEITVHFRLENPHLVCTITDNGVGRERSSHLREARKPGHQSTALLVTQERLAAMGGSLEIHDRLDTAQQVCGTVVIVRVRIA